MSMNTKSHTYLLVFQTPWVLTLVAMLVWTAFRIYTGIVLEDALITYRYALNLSQHAEFAYNLGERILGTTTPLYTMWLASASSIAGERSIFWISNVSMMLAAGGTGLLTWYSLRRTGYPAAVSFVAVALFYFHPDTLWMVVGGMETPLVLLLMSASLFLLLLGRLTWVSVCAGMLLLTRPDGIIWAGIILFASLFFFPKQWLKIFAPFCILLALWVLASTAYFGSALPQTVTAKAQLGTREMGSHLGSLSEIKRFINWTLPALAFPFGGEGMSSGRFWVLPFLLILSLPSILTMRLRWPLLTLSIFAVSFPVTLFAANAPTHFPWYLVPFTWATITLATLGIFELRVMLTAYAKEAKLPKFVPNLLFAGLALIVAASTIGASYSELRYQKRWQTNENTVRREVGEWLSVNTPGNARIAMEAIGYQGFYSGRYIIDLAGLVTPTVIEEYKRSEDNASAFASILQVLEPDYLVLRSFEVDENRHFWGGPLFANSEEEEFFAENYVEVKRFSEDSEFWGKLGHLTIYSKLPP